MVQELFEGCVEPVEGITSYSWRRVAPSLVLGDWQDKGQLRSATGQCRSITQPQNTLTLGLVSSQILLRFPVLGIGFSGGC